MSKLLLAALPLLTAAAPPTAVLRVPAAKTRLAPSGARPLGPLAVRSPKAVPPPTEDVDSCGGIFGLDFGDAAPPRVGERFEYELTMAGAYMGKLELSVGTPRKLPSGQAVPLMGRVRTNAFVSALKPVEGRYMAMIDTQSLLPLGAKVEATIGDDPRWETIRFLEGGTKGETRYLFRGKEAQRSYDGSHRLLEGLSLLHFARQAPLLEGLSACQEVISTRRLWRIHATVLGKETVETPVGDKPAYRVRASFARVRPDGKKARGVEIDILLGDMPGRPPLAFEMRRGDVSGRARLLSWKPGKAS